MTDHAGETARIALFAEKWRWVLKDGEKYHAAFLTECLHLAQQPAAREVVCIDDKWCGGQAEALRQGYQTLLAQHAALVGELARVREAASTLAIKRVGFGLSGHLIVDGHETICNAGDFDSVSDAEIRVVMLNVLRALTPPPAERAQESAS